MSKLLWWATVGALVAVASYVAMVRFPVGQRIDFSAYEGRKWIDLAFRQDVTLVVRFATPVVVIGAAVAAVLVAARRRGLVAAVAAAAGLPVTVFLASGLKGLLPRHELLPGSWISADNTFPSGHVASVAVTMLVAVSVSPPRSRPAVSIVAVAAVSLQILGIAGSGWHRPSDIVGGLGLAVVVAALASIPIVRGWRGRPEPSRQPWWSAPENIVRGSLAVVSATLLWYGFGRLLGGRSYGSFLLHLFTIQSVVVVGFSMVVLHSRIVDADDVAQRAVAVGIGPGVQADAQAGGGSPAGKSASKTTPRSSSI